MGLPPALVYVLRFRLPPVLLHRQPGPANARARELARERTQGGAEAADKGRNSRHEKLAERNHVI